MNESTNHQDDKLISLLRRGFHGSDPTPADVTEFAKAALSWRNVDAELAQLTFDSVDDTTAVRGVAVARMLAFESGDLMIDLEHDPASGYLRGQLEPAGQMAIELHVLDTVLVTESDELGRFAFDGIHSGPFALVIRFEGDEAVKTEWIIL